MSKVDTKDLFDQAADLAADMEEIYEKRTANRTLLRLLRDTGQLSDGEVEQLEELYPPRQRGEAEPDEEQE